MKIEIAKRPSKKHIKKMIAKANKASGRRETFLSGLGDLYVVNVLKDIKPIPKKYRKVTL